MVIVEGGGVRVVLRRTHVVTLPTKHPYVARTHVITRTHTDVESENQHQVNLPEKTLTLRMQLKRCR